MRKGLGRRGFRLYGPLASAKPAPITCNEVMQCPVCLAAMEELKESRYGGVLVCSRFPACKYTWVRPSE